MTTEMGKTLKSAGDEALKCAWACRYYADNAEKFLANEEVATNAGKSFIAYQPLGVVLAVMPWNFPFWQVFRFAAPALMAGNTGLLKHASNVPQSALAIEEILCRAGFSNGEFLTLLIGSSQVARVLDDKRVVAATLTGSEPAGREVASQCGRQIKKTVLELGGSDPFIVMPSANLDEAVQTGVRARCINNGQSCISAKRFIVHESIYAEFEKKFTEGMEVEGGRSDGSSDRSGADRDGAGASELEEQVQRAVAAGAKLLTGGKRVNGPGNFYEPTVLATFRRAALSITRRFSALWQWCSGPRESTKRSRSPTIPISDWRRVCGRTTIRAVAFHWRDRSGRGVRQWHGRVRSEAAVWRREELGISGGAKRRRDP